MKYNFTERIKAALINFAGRRNNPRGDDDEIFETRSSEEDIDAYENALLTDSDNELFKDAYSKVIHSYSDLITIAADDDFMKKFHNKHDKDGKFNEFKSLSNIATNWYAEAKKKAERNAIKSAAAYKVAKGVAGALTNGLEEPARGFIEGMMNMMADLGVDVAKIKALKNDDFDAEKALKSLTGKKDPLGEVTQQTGQQFDEDSSKNDDSDDADSNDDLPNNSSSDSTDLESIKKDLMENWDSNKWRIGSIESKKEMIKDKKFDEFLRTEHKRAWNNLHRELGDLSKNFSERILSAFNL